MGKIRNLIVVLGDQLDEASAAFEGFDAAEDCVFMAEVAEESTHVWSHKARTALFLSAMRHFRDRLRGRSYRVHYVELDEPGNRGSLGEELKRAIAEFQPQRVIAVEPGDYRVRRQLENVTFRPDTHFYCSVDEFRQHAAGRKQLRMEFFYREMRKRTGCLMVDGKPAGGAWNFDAENRESFRREGPDAIPQPIAFAPDATTREVLAVVERRFATHPGSHANFDWPVTREQALLALYDFVRNRLPHFGRYQDAMWASEPYLYHSRLSAALNLKLLNPREVVGAVEQAWREGAVPLAAAEGFIRQILGWREYVRGIYWLFMPDYAGSNALNAQHPLPPFYWTGDTEMRCLREAIGQTLEYGYAHHIQRLMVTGLYALLLGVRPREIHEWYLAVYVDAVEWVEMPNVIGMSQFADGGRMSTKPYVASGKYIDRMSNYCSGCRFDPAASTGANACPFTTLYWDFLMRHEALLRSVPRMEMQLRNAARMPSEQRAEIRNKAQALMNIAY